MTYAISDIHGCLEALKNLLSRLDLTQEDSLIFLGDYIDRGPNSKGVVDFLLNFDQEYIHLIGNHELFLQKAFTSEQDLSFFKQELVGGEHTLTSYGGELTDIPKNHLKFLLEDSSPYYETSSHIFVHGGVNAQLDLSDQTVETFTWKRFQEALPHKSSKIVICGHTIVGDVPKVKGGHTIGIDTGAGKGGWITALEIETNRYFQANEEGDVREGRLEL